MSVVSPALVHPLIAIRGKDKQFYYPSVRQTFAYCTPILGEITSHKRLHTMTLLVTYLLVAIGVSFVCSILEAVLLSVTPGFVETTLNKHPRRGQILHEVRENLDQSIASILILNTFAHTMGAAGVGAQAVKVFGPRFETLVAFLLTLAILYFSEIIPKTL
ncbi:MAG: CBS domain containing-hemolysin-like protein, partial [Bacteroidia bacterium]